MKTPSTVYSRVPSFYCIIKWISREGYGPFITVNECKNPCKIWKENYRVSHRLTSPRNEAEGRRFAASRQSVRETIHLNIKQKQFPFATHVGFHPILSNDPIQHNHRIGTCHLSNHSQVSTTPITNMTILSITMNRFCVKILSGASHHPTIYLRLSLISKMRRRTVDGMSQPQYCRPLFNHPY